MSDVLRVGMVGYALHGLTVDDAALFTARFAGGATGVLEATRFALGRKNVLRIEINGTDGSLAFDFEENNLLQFFDGTQPVEEQGFRRILVTEPEHPYVGAWWPPGHGLGYEHGFTHQVVDLVAAIADNRQPTPSFDDGLRVQRVLGAVEDSAARDSAWTGRRVSSLSATLRRVGEERGYFRGLRLWQWPDSQHRGVLTRLLLGADPRQRDDRRVKSQQVAERALHQGPTADGQQLAYGVQAVEPAWHRVGVAPGHSYLYRRRCC